MKSKKRNKDEFWKVKLDNETLNSIWDASKHTMEKNKKKYSRKSKHKTDDYEE
ncbi:MAG: hypothetical protein NZ811_08835 [Gammaproteobacteria bacterium]|nr:hypothetical protein [Gammaproteobacteria bacterium]